jgi:6-phosphogluconolactonase
VTREISRHRDGEAVARAAAGAVAGRIAAGVARRGAFSLVLAGGSTPKRAYELLAAEHGGLPWESVHVFWGDESCVPPDDPDSNYAMSKTALLDRVSIPAANVHRIRGELGASIAADECERDLRAYFGAKAAPAFDLVLLGMGEDGHTASLFPGNAALAETKRWAVPVETTAKAPRWRVSLSMTALSAASEAMFLVTGAGKRAVLAEIVANPAAAASRYPAAAVAAARVTWFVDDAADGDSVR